MKRSRCVAIVGVACRFPFGESPDEFWNALVKGQNLVQLIPPDRWDVEAYYSPDKEAVGKTYVRHAAFLTDIRFFDNKIFNITDEEARYMDVQQKIALEVAYRAFEDAGMSLDDVHGSNTSVYMGQMNDDFSRSIEIDEVTSYSATGLGRAILSNRISYQFDLRGPSATIDTACSSSLMCLHLGIQSILAGESVMAVCGGVSIIQSPSQMAVLSKAGMSSRTGQSYSFSDRADGYVRGEGCGIIIIKQLEQAIRDKDRIWCLVATGANQDGKSVSPITMPSSMQQEDLIRRLYRDCEIKLEWISVAEAHGTGTKAGDPIETKALGNTIGAARRQSGKGPCVIGSVKTNIGHLESAAGVAGLIKAILMLKYQKVVPSLHFDVPNPSIDFTGLNLSVCTKVADWPATEDKSPKLLCVNSFGYGGTNVHAVLEYFDGQASVTRSPASSITRPWPILVTAASIPSLVATLKHARDHAETSICDLQSLAYTSSVRRMHFNFRTAFLVNSIDQFRLAADQKLTAIQQQSGNLIPATRDVQVMFAFCGMGTTYVGMGKELRNLEPVFAASLLEIDGLIQRFTGWSVIEKMYGGDHELDSPEYAQPALFAVQVSLVRLLKSWGIVPDVIVGHSVGEVAASFASNRLSLEDATKVICVRGKIVAKVRGGSMMVAENFQSGIVDKLLKKYSSRVSIAAINYSNCYTLSGDSDAIDMIEAELKSYHSESSQTLLKKLTVNTAFHSHHMDPIKDELLRALSGIKQPEVGNGQSPVPVYSTVTGKLAVRGDLIDPAYWVNNVRNKVLFQPAFTEGLQRLKKASMTCLVEIGPRPALGRYMKSVVTDLKAKTIVVATMKPSYEVRELYSTLTKLFEVGVNITWKKFFEGNETQLCPIPQYQYQKKDLYCDLRQFKQNRAGNVDAVSGNKSVETASHSFLRRLSEDNTIFVAHLNAPETSFINEHQLAQRPTVPGAMFLECGLAGVWLSCKAKLETISVSVNFNRLLVLSEASDQTKTMEVTVSRRDSWSSKVSSIVSYDYEVSSDDVLHASGSAEIAREIPMLPSSVDMNELRLRCTEVIDQEAFYSKLKSLNFSYGLQFRVVQSCLCTDGECLATVAVFDEVAEQFPSSVLHPCLGDAVLQLSCVIMKGSADAKQMVPRCIRRVNVVRLPDRSVFVYIKRSSIASDNRILVYDAIMVNKYGEVYATFEGVTITATDARIGCHPTECLFSLEWKPFKPESSDDSDRKSLTKSKSNIKDAKRLVVFEDKMGIAKRVVGSLQNNDVSCSDYVYLKADRNFVKKLHADMLSLKNCLPQPLADYQRILYFWQLDAMIFEDMTAEEVQSVITDACFSLCQIVKYIMSLGLEIPVTVITKNVCELMHNYPGISPNDNNHALELDHADKKHLLTGVSGYTVTAMVRTLALEPGCPPIECIDLTRCDEDDIAMLIHQMLGKYQHQNPEISFFLGQTWKPELLPGLAPFGSLTRKVRQTPSVMFEAVQTSRQQYVLTQCAASKTKAKPVNNGHTYIPCDVIKMRFDTIGMLVDRTKLADDKCGTFAADILARTKLNGTKDCKVHVLGLSSVDSRQYVDSRRCVPYSLFPINEPVISIVFLAWYIVLNTTTGKLLARNRCKITCNDALPEFQYLKNMLEEIPRRKENRQTNTNALHVTIVFAKKLQHIYSLLSSNAKSVAGPDCYLILTNFESSLATQNLSSEWQEKIDVVCVPPLFELSNAKYFEKFRQWLKSQGAPFTHVEDRMLTFRTKTMNSASECIFELDNSTDSDASGSELPVIDLSLYGKTVPLALSKFQLFNSTSHYIVVGGSRGLGWELIKYMVSLGAKYVVSWSRSSPDNGVRNEATRLEIQSQCSIHFRKVNVSSKHEVSREIKACGGELFRGTELGGVFHGAVVLDDTAVVTMDLDRFTRVLLPKVNGTWNLHQLTKDKPVEYFVLHSSIASVIGNPGQTNYTAGNAFQDAMAVYRRKIGLSGQSISWSGLEVGVILNAQHAVRRLQSIGLAMLSIADILECFDFALLSNRTHSVMARISWRQMLKKAWKDEAYFRLASYYQFFSTRYNRYLSSLKTRNLDREPNNDSRQGIDQLTVDDIRTFIRQTFVENVPGFEDNPLDDADARELGADSLNIVSVMNKMKKKFEIPESELTESAVPTLTVNALYAVVLKHVGPVSKTLMNVNTTSSTDIKRPEELVTHL